MNGETSMFFRHRWQHRWIFPPSVVEQTVERHLVALGSTWLGGKEPR